jgi:hypothetical protein
MGVIHIVFTTIWKLVATIISSLLRDIGINKDISFLFFKTAGYYILISVSALVTYDMMREVSRPVAVLVGAAGVFIIYTTIAGNLERNRWRAVMNYERKRTLVMRYDGYLLVASLLLYLVSLIIPTVAGNPVVAWFRQLIDDIYHVPVLGWIVRIGALFYMISIILKGMKATDYLLHLVIGREDPSVGGVPPAGWPGMPGVEGAPEDEFIEYEEISPDETDGNSNGTSGAESESKSRPAHRQSGQ